MAFISKSKLVSNLLYGDVLSGNAFFYKLHLKVVNIITIAYIKISFKISAEIGRGDIEIIGNGFYLHLFWLINILMYIRDNLVVIKGAASYRKFHAFHGFPDKAED